MSNNKQSRIYQCVKSLSQGVNNLGIQTTIINAYEKLLLELHYKNKVISNLEEEIKLMQSNVIDKDALFIEVKEASLNSIMDDFKSGGEISDYILKTLYPKLYEENETLKEQRDYYKLGHDNSHKVNEKLRGEVSNLKHENEKLVEKIKDLDMKFLTESSYKVSCCNKYKADILALKGNLYSTDEINKSLKEENEKLKQNFSALKIGYETWKSVAIKTEMENESIKRLMKTYTNL